MNEYEEGRELTEEDLDKVSGGHAADADAGVDADAEAGGDHDA